MSQEDTRCSSLSKDQILKLVSDLEAHGKGELKIVVSRGKARKAHSSKTYE